MIKDEKEYLWSKKKIREEVIFIEELKLKMKKSGLNEDQIKLAIDPLVTFNLNLKEEVEAYESNFLLFKQSESWENLLKKIIIKARKCPAIQLCSNSLISAETLDNAAGNHSFDDNYLFWEITKDEGHEIRAVFQKYSIRNNLEFKKYIERIIEDSY